MMYIFLFLALLLGVFIYMKFNGQKYFYFEQIPLELKDKVFSPFFKEKTLINYDELVLVHILHIGFDNLVHKGEIIVNKKIACDVVDIFSTLYINNYKIEKVELMDKYNWDDNLSMEDNNTSAFNYRYIENTNRLSNHSYGLAIDINPLYNPYIYTKDNKVVILPKCAIKYANREKNFNYKIDKNDLAYKLFIAHGFSWGGDWCDKKDYQHFEKS